jgi:hypothetical protein
MSKSENANQYAVKILACLNELFQEDSEHYIGIEELSEENNATDFLHALANIAPTHTYNKISGEETEMLAFNHIANRLCFQYCQPERKEKKK